MVKHARHCSCCRNIALGNSDRSSPAFAAGQALAELDKEDPEYRESIR